MSERIGFLKTYFRLMLHDPELEEDIKMILTEGREENYRRAYRFLAQLTKQGKEPER